MAHVYTLQFLHRVNEDGTIDSICCDCFTTVATRFSKRDLELEEKEHNCDSLLLERYKSFGHRENSSLLISHPQGRGSR